jgi:transposase
MAVVAQLPGHARIAVAKLAVHLPYKKVTLIMNTPWQSYVEEE